MLPDILPQPVEQGAEIAFLNIAIMSAARRAAAINCAAYIAPV